MARRGEYMSTPPPTNLKTCPEIVAFGPGVDMFFPPVRMYIYTHSYTYIYTHSYTSINIHIATYIYIYIHS